MSEQPDQQGAVDRAQMQASLAAITAQLASLGDQVAAIARAANIAAPGAEAPASRATVDASGAEVPAPGAEVPASRATVDASDRPRAADDLAPAAPTATQQAWSASPAAPPPPEEAEVPPPVATLPPPPHADWPVPQGAVIPGVPGAGPPAGQQPYGPVPGQPGSAPSVPPSATAEPTGPISPTPHPERRTASAWADTSGLKALGWVGGGVTVLGVMMLLVVAIQQGLLTAETRVGIGAGLAVVLVVGGYLLRRKESQASVAVTLVCTGLATGLLTITGATRLDHPLTVGAAYALCVVVVAAALAIARSWRESWIAGAAFAASALLTPIVARHIDIGAYAFETVLLAGAAGALLLGLGMIVWAATGLAVTFVLVVAMSTNALDPAGLLAVIVMALIAWSLFYGRWLTGRAPRDPGPFPLRQRSVDPEQVARDYADFHAHQARVETARTDAAAAGVSLGISGAFLAIGFALVTRPEYLDKGVAAGAALFAILFGILAWVSGRIPAISHISARLIAWSTAVAMAAVALLRFFDGDARAVSWLVLAIAVFVVVGVERMSVLVLPAITLGVVALVGSGQALSPRAVILWPSRGILAEDGGLLPRAWQAVLPAGLCVLALCLAAWWAVSRCSAAEVDAARQTSRQVASGVRPAGAEPATRDLAAAESWHTAVMAWTIVCCSLVACYGLLVVTMVLAYAISPTRAGFQAGQIVVTLLVTLVALVLLWQGFRRFILRIGGLCIALVAVTKLLLVDTGTLEALPRSLTVIGVGLLLLLAAVGYVVALSRMRAEQERELPRS